MIEFVVGAGGKTSYIHQRAKEETALGHRVLVCTSTHMLIEDDTLITDQVSEIKERLDRCGYCMAGSQASDQKMGPLNQEVYLSACKLADVVLVEADGSKHHPIKACNQTEPVIYDNAEKITVIMGMHALNKPFEEAAFRLEQVCRLLDVKPEETVTPDHIVQLIQKAYLQPLREKYPDVAIEVHCVGYTLYQKAVAAMINQGQDVSILHPAWFSEKPVLFLCGGGHVSLALAKMAAILEMDVIVMDDRQEFANSDRFSMAKQVICDDYANLHRYLLPNAYYVIVTSGHMADSICARQLLQINAPYLGMIGSKVKVARAKEALKDVWSDRIYAPIGLDIRANTPSEIAVSILAQIIQVKNASAHSSASRELLETPKNGVLCILIEKKGSSPRDIGSMMLVTDDGVIDTIGGGILESRVIQRAKTIDSVTSEKVVLEDIGMACASSNTVLYIPIR